MLEIAAYSSALFLGNITISLPYSINIPEKIFSRSSSVKIHRYDIAHYLAHPLVKEFIELNTQRILKVNSLDTEILCLVRWLVMRDVFDGCIYSDRDMLLMQDWDTIVLEKNLGLCETVIRESLVIGNFHMPGGRHSRDQMFGWPIWTVCPNIILFKQNIIYEYIDMYEKYLLRSRRIGRSIHASTFCDMAPWSSVLSRKMLEFIRFPDTILEFNDLFEGGNLVGEHNISSSLEKNHVFESTISELGHGLSYQHKKVYFRDDGRPMLFSHSTDSFLNPISLHYSGVEGKLLLVHNHMRNIKGFLSQ